DTVTKGTLVQKITANGIVRADKELDVSANISGVISEINIYDGKYVNKNDILIRLDDREYQINLREAEERIIEAKVNYGFLIKDAPTDSTKSEEKEIITKQLIELEKQYENSLITEEEYNEKKDELDMKLIFTGAKREELILNKSGYNAAINQIDKAKLNLDYTVIRAPFNGVIGNFDLVIGERIGAGDKLFKLFSTYTMKIDINILESELNKVSIGNNVEIEIPALPEEKFIGKVSQISPYIDTENRTSKIVLSIKNIDSKIKPGMFAKVLVASKTLNDKILIPKDALLVRDKRNLVFTVEDSLAKWKYVDIGEQNDKYIEVINGVNAGENIIVEGHFNLAHDSKVRIIN
ncbi:MAG: efflux RND transporter periplasmic adaptor subunit, partial [Ignavibacteriae bacterium]|nr:efflux RND transporter periplasmic adaptor subunit [Ignavibacteriota bacterium]